MAGLGAGAGAAERMMFDDKMAEQAAQAAANRKLRREEMAEGARRFDAQRADAQARQQAADARQAKLDAEASAQTARNNARQDRLDQINLGQLNRQNERQDRLDAAAMEDAAWKRDRAERLDAQAQERQDWTDAWTSVFNQQRLEQQQAALDRQNALDQEIFDNINREREARALRQQGLDEAKERLVNFAINAPQEYRDPASQYAYIQAMNAQLTQLTGKDHGLTRMSFDPQSGGIAFWGVQRDDKGNVVLGENGAPAERLLDFISRDNVDAIAEKRGLQYDPYQQAFVQKGSTAYTGGGRAAASGRGASAQGGGIRTSRGAGSSDGGWEKIISDTEAYGKTRTELVNKLDEAINQLNAGKDAKSGITPKELSAAVDAARTRLREFDAARDAFIDNAIGRNRNEEGEVEGGGITDRIRSGDVAKPNAPTDSKPKSQDKPASASTTSNKDSRRAALSKIEAMGDKAPTYSFAAQDGTQKTVSFSEAMKMADGGDANARAWIKSVVNGEAKKPASDNKPSAQQASASQVIETDKGLSAGRRVQKNLSRQALARHLREHISDVEGQIRMFRQQGENARADEIESGLAKDRERLRRIDSMTDKALLEQEHELQSELNIAQHEVDHINPNFDQPGEITRKRERLARAKADYDKFNKGK